MKRAAVMVATALLLLAFSAGPAFAVYGSQPGYEVANENTECAGHGSFGAFGDKGDVVHDFGVNYPGSNNKPGANGQATGYNNSHLCGKPQNAP